MVLSTGNDADVMRAASIMLAGVPMRGQDVLDLARLLRDTAFHDTGRGTRRRIGGRTSNRRALDSGSRGDCPDAGRSQTDSFAELRGVLLRKHKWRVREGLV